ncbi:MAG: sigma 54-interacting transcriptional regulator [Deltaproteobacteria bacterium]|nr:sigma 54-interacting transcriptional regulator [Deltaproteobacteria bacterium]
MGRERDLAWLAARLEATVAGATSMVALDGPAGVGKSRLLDELRDHARAGGFPVLEGWCAPHAAYAPWVALTAQALALLRARAESDALDAADLDALTPLLNPRARAPREIDDPSEAAVRFVEAVGRLLSAVARPRPVLLLVRGWAVADEASRALTRALLDAAGPVGEPTPGAPTALLVVGVRDPESVDPHPRVERRTLAGLDADGVRALLADPEVVSRLQAATAGNPEALLGLLGRMPPSREVECSARVQALGALGQDLLAVLALAGRPLPVQVLAGSVGEDPQRVARTLPALIAAGVVWRALDPAVGDVVQGLHHRDDGQAALGIVGPERQRQLQGTLADTLEGWGKAPPEELVRHRLAGSASPVVAAQAAEVADLLVRRHAPAAALGLLQKSAPCASAETLARSARVAVAAARALGAQAQARPLVVSARARLPEDPELARLDAWLCLDLGALDEASRALSDARGYTPPENTPQRARNAALEAEVAFARGAWDLVDACCQEALGLDGDEAARTQARNTLTKLHLVRGRLDEGRASAQEGLSRARALGLHAEVLRGLLNLAVVAIHRGALDEAEAHLHDARAASVRSDARLLLGVLCENEAVVAHMRGHLGDALRNYHEALGVLSRVGNRRFLARVAHNLGELYVQVGEVTRARRLCDYASQVARGLGGPVVAEGFLLRARVELEDGRSDAAGSALESVRQAFASAGSPEPPPDVALLGARAALADGDLERASAELARVPSAPGSAPERVLAERALYLQELLRGRGADSLGAARSALEHAERAEDTELRYRAHAALAQSLLDRQDTAAARRHAVHAQGLREALAEQVPEALRVSWRARIDRAGVDALAGRLEALEHRPSAPGAPHAPTRAVPEPVQGLLGESAPMRELRRRIARVAPQDVTVLLWGESGTGKERAAEALHQASPRRAGPLVKVNCAALAEGVLLSELFGHEKGAFTGADRRRRGRFELADGGTIFLDEIGDVSEATQAALLRVLQEHAFERVGGNETLRVDVRVVAATHRDLPSMVREGRFREDLFYRLTSLTLTLPPLRERLEDLPALAAFLLEREARSRGERSRRLTGAALRRLSEHPWPGNVRELENVLRASALFADGEELQADDLQGLSRGAELRPSVLPPAPAAREAPEVREVDVVYQRIRSGGVSLFDMRRDLERGCIARALEESGGNITRAAGLLGMKRPRLSQLVREYGLARTPEADDNTDP